MAGIKYFAFFLSLLSAASSHYELRFEAHYRGFSSAEFRTFFLIKLTCLHFSLFFSLWPYKSRVYKSCRDKQVGEICIKSYKLTTFMAANYNSPLDKA